MEKLVLYEQNMTYGTIYLNRPEKRNALSINMAQQFKQTLDEAKEESISLLLIKSKGEQTFCAGGDLNDFHAALTEEEAYKSLHIIKQILVQLITFPVPTICVMQGDAFGGGCELATACDIRIAKENSKFGFVQSNLGILPGWGGGAILYEKVMPSFAFQWLTEGTIYDASFLANKGWLHHVIPKDEWNDQVIFLKDYMKKSKKQMRFLKSQYLESLQIPTLIEKMDKELARCTQLWNSDRHQQVVQRFLTEKKG